MPAGARVQFLLPAMLLKVPEMHKIEEVDPALAENEPARARVQALAPPLGPLNEPETHDVYTPVLPTRDENDPPGTTLQAEDPAAAL